MTHSDGLPPLHDIRTTFGLLRHGLTLWNEEKRIQGAQDSPLSEQGRERISEITPSLKQFKWTRILASDLGRAMQTVEIINASLQLPVNYDRDLREINWGDWEGKTLRDISSSSPGEIEKQVEAGWNFRAPNGESRSETLLRARTAILNAAEKWPGEKILVVCHQGIIKCLVYDILQCSFLPGENVHLKKDGLHLLQVSQKKIACDRLNIVLP